MIVCAEYDPDTARSILMLPQSDAEFASPDPIRIKRGRRLLHAGVSSFLSKGFIFAVNALSVPIVLRYLGPEQFGIWITITSTLVLLILLDFGIAGAVTNRISEAYALADQGLAGNYATTAFLVMALIALVFGVFGFLAWPFIPWASLFHLSGSAQAKSVSQAAAVAYCAFLVGLPINLASRFLAGYQELKSANIASAIATAANLITLIVLVWMHRSLVLLVAGPAAASFAANLGCMAWLCLWHKPWLMPRLSRWKVSLVFPLLQGGVQLFLLQLAGFIVFNSDNFVIAHYLGASQVTPYSVTWRLVGYAGVLQSVVTPALWPAYAEAWIRHDISWIRKTLRGVMRKVFGVAIPCLLIFAIWGRSIVLFWAGPSAVPSQPLLLMMCCWVVLNIYTANTITVLLATDNIRQQAWLSPLSAILNLAASIWLVQRIGSIGVIIGTVASYLLILVVPQTVQVMRVLRTQPGTPQISSEAAL